MTPELAAALYLLSLAASALLWLSHKLGLGLGGLV